MIEFLLAAALYDRRVTDTPVAVDNNAKFNLADITFKGCAERIGGLRSFSPIGARGSRIQANDKGQKENAEQSGGSHEFYAREVISVRKKE